MARLFRFAVRAAALAALLVGAACYELTEEAIGLDTARPIDFILGEWTFGNSRKVNIYPGDYPNEYRYRDASDKEVDTGTMRVVPLGGAIFLIQAKDDKGGIYALFYRRAPDGRVSELEGNDKAWTMADRFRVKLDFDDEVTVGLTGARADVRAFLLAHGPSHLGEIAY